MHLKRLFRKLLFSLIIVNVFSACNINLTEEEPGVFTSSFEDNKTRYWIGPEFWANRLQDWQLNQGRIECVDGALPMRTVHLLTRAIDAAPGELLVSVQTGLLNDNAPEGKDHWAGLLIGAGSLNTDYRRRALVHRASGDNAGFIAAVTTSGDLIFLDNENNLTEVEANLANQKQLNLSTNQPVNLELHLIQERTSASLELRAKDQKGKVINRATIQNFPATRLSGNLALVANGGTSEGGPTFWFDNLTVEGSKVNVKKDQKFGPVLGAQYTLSKGVLNLTAQMPPIGDNDPQSVVLEVSPAGRNNWQQVGEEEIKTPSYTAEFKVENWDDSKNYDYRLKYPMEEEGRQYSGSIKKDPIRKEEIVVGAFSGNINSLGTINGDQFSFSQNQIWFPHEDLITNVARHTPDLLVYSGDQVYGNNPTPAVREGGKKSQLDYLYKWYLWYWAHGELARNIPTVCMTDDHDLYQENIWGVGGKLAPEAPGEGNFPARYEGYENYWRQDQGGYIMSPQFINMVKQTQTSHLPEPYDATPVKNDIGVYYTDLLYGGISFAITEDRKFKDTPSKILPWANVINGFPQVPVAGNDLDPPWAELLGNRQMDFLEEWTADWKGAWMKVALSQTILANLSTVPDTFNTDAGISRLDPLPDGMIPHGYKKSKNMDSNGWPQTARNEALRVLRKGYTFMIGGDQHLGNIIHHGADTWNDSGFSFGLPSIANLTPKRWFPGEPGRNHSEGMPPYTGRYYDGLDNRITVWAVANPYISGQSPSRLHDNAPGYGIIKLNKDAQEITMECWPRYANPNDPDANQYPGWPKTIDLMENYGRNARAYLPELKVEGLSNPPVIQVIDQSNNEIVYTVRAKGNSFRPKVFHNGNYTVRLGEPGTDQMQTLKNVTALPPSNTATKTISF